MSRLAADTPGPDPAPAAAAEPAPGASSGASFSASADVDDPLGRSRPTVGGVLQGIALTLGLVLLLGGFGLTAFLYRVYSVPTGSMEPTIAVGNTVLARAVDGGKIGRGDVVVFQDPTWGNETMVKRVIGIGGDTVACCDAQHRITVNGTPIDEPYLAAGGPPSADFSAKVPAGRLFLLGDNRTGSLDSRVHLGDFDGTVPVGVVKGRVEATVWPAGHAGLLGRTVAFDALGGPAASGPGPVRWLVSAMPAGVVLIVLTSLAGPVAALGRRLRR
ncbi:signal peptidase I [Kitasatospora sp. LaBMicrA B282]|uniref:signal peptidase I n=1 Tax=Kitasatospora sp. LaBMicrA B282 TaxID=3420949 RepID=UPI003D1099D3